MVAAVGVGELLLDLGDAAILQLAGLREVAPALRLLELGARGVELALEHRLGVDLVLVGAPPLGQFGRLLLEVGELALERAEAVLRRGILFLLQRLALDPELHDAAVEILDFLGLGFDLHPQPRWPPSSIRSIALSGRKRSAM